MDTGIVTIGKNGEYEIRLVNQSLKTFFQAASQDIDYFPYSIKEIFSHVSAKLNQIINDKRAAKEDLNNLDDLKKGALGNIFNEVEELEWNLAWVIYKLSEIRVPEWDTFFSENYQSIMSYKNHCRLIDLLDLITAKEDDCMEIMEKYDKHFIEEVKAFNNELQERSKDVLLMQVTKILKDQTKIIGTLRETIRLINESKATIEALNIRLRESEKKSEELQAKLTMADDNQKRMESEECRNEIGQEYFKRLMDKYLESSNKLPQGTRTKWHETLQGLCLIEGVPEDVKIKLLQYDKGNSMTVNTQTYVETQNNNYK